MGRLIDIEDLQGCAIIRPQKHSEFELIKQFSDIVSHDDIPTAYNVDKVVEEMEKLKNHYRKCCLVDYNEGAAVATEECMSIARVGGVNG